MLGKILGTILSWAGAALCAFGIYKIADMIWSGFTSKDLWLVIGGGILAYFFIGLLIVGVIGLTILGFIILTE